MEIDPAAVVKARSVVVTLGGAEYRINARAAVGWLIPILEKDWADVVPGMLDDPLGTTTLDDLFDQLSEGTVTTGECQKAAQDAVSAVSGVHWWTAARLIHVAAQDPGAIGELRLSGIDLDTAPLGAVIAALYRIYTRDREEKDVRKFDAELMKPPPGVSAADRYDEDAAAQAFEQMFTARGGR